MQALKRLLESPESFNGPPTSETLNSDLGERRQGGANHGAQYTLGQEGDGERIPPIFTYLCCDYGRATAGLWVQAGMSRRT